MKRQKDVSISIGKLNKLQNIVQADKELAVRLKG